MKIVDISQAEDATSIFAREKNKLEVGATTQFFVTEQYSKNLKTGDLIVIVTQYHQYFGRIEQFNDGQVVVFKIMKVLKTDTLRETSIYEDFIEAARTRAHELGLANIPSETLLHTMVQRTGSIAHEILVVRNKIPTASVEKAIKELDFESTNSGSSTEEFDFSSEAAMLIQLAEAWSARLGHDYLGTEHLLLAMLTCPNTNISKVLQHLEIVKEEYVDETLSFLDVLSQDGVILEEQDDDGSKACLIVVGTHEKFARIKNATEPDLVNNWLEEFGGSDYATEFLVFHIDPNFTQSICKNLDLRTRRDLLIIEEGQVSESILNGIDLQFGHISKVCISAKPKMPNVVKFMRRPGAIDVICQSVHDHDPYAALRNKPYDYAMYLVKGHVLRVLKGRYQQKLQKMLQDQRPSFWNKLKVEHDGSLVALDVCLENPGDLKVVASDHYAKGLIVKINILYEKELLWKRPFEIMASRIMKL